MKKKIKTYSIQFIKEIIPVVVGILIALFIDNWNSQRKDKAYIDQVFLTINSELEDSREDIKFILPKQKALIKALELHTDNTEMTILEIVMGSKGIYIPQIKINAWRAVSTTKIDLIAYEKVTSLSNIAELKEILSNKSEYLMNFLYSNVNQTDKNTKQTFKLILLDIIQTENTLQQCIELFEKENVKK